MTSYPVEHAARHTHAALSAADLAALKESNRNLSDLDGRTMARAHEGFRHAYDVAKRVADGRIDPLSAK